jgi:hypothetical protein
MRRVEEHSRCLPSSLSPAVNEEWRWTFGDPGLVVTAVDNLVAWYLSISNTLDAVAREPGRLLLAADTNRGKTDIDDIRRRCCDDNHDDGCQGLTKAIAASTPLLDKAKSQVAINEIVCFYWSNRYDLSTDQLERSATTARSSAFTLLQAPRTPAGSYENRGAS